MFLIGEASCEILISVSLFKYLGDGYLNMRKSRSIFSMCLVVAVLSGQDCELNFILISSCTLF